MDLDRLLNEPPLGEVQFSEGKPLDSSVRSVVDETALAVEEEDIISQLESLATFAGDGFMEPVSDEQLEEWSLVLVDAKDLDLDSYHRVMSDVRSEIASALMLSLIRETERLTGEAYPSSGAYKSGIRETERLTGEAYPSSGGYESGIRETERLTGEAYPSSGGYESGSVSSYYSRIFDEWNLQLGQAIRDVFSEGIRSFYSSFQELLHGGSQIVTEPGLEQRLRDLESRRSQLEEQAYRLGVGIGRRLPDLARQYLRVCDQLLDFLQLVINGLDVMIAVSSVRVLSAFRGWKEQLRQRVESIARNQVADMLAMFGRNVVDPIFRKFLVLRDLRNMIYDLAGDIKELQLLDHLNEQIEDWWQQYNRWVYSVRDQMRRYFRFGTELSVQVKQYDVLYRRRRICSLLMGIVRSFRSGLIDGLSSRGSQTQGSQTRRSRTRRSQTQSSGT